MFKFSLKYIPEWDKLKLAAKSKFIELIPKWDRLKLVTKSKFINTMYIWIFLVPIILKWFELIEKTDFLFNVFGQKIPIKFELPFNLMLFYFSALSFAIANLLFKFNCPKIILENDHFSDFESQGKTLAQLQVYKKDISTVQNQLSKTIDKEINDQHMKNENIYYHNEELVEINKLKFWKIYKYANEIRKKRSRIIGFLYLIGFVLFGLVLLENLRYVVSIIS